MANPLNAWVSGARKDARRPQIFGGLLFCGSAVALAEISGLVVGVEPKGFFYACFVVLLTVPFWCYWVPKATALDARLRYGDVIKKEWGRWRAPEDGHPFLDEYVRTVLFSDNESLVDELQRDPEECVRVLCSPYPRMEKETGVIGWLFPLRKCRWDHFLDWYKPYETAQKDAQKPMPMSLTREQVLHQFERALEQKVEDHERVETKVKELEARLMKVGDSPAQATRTIQIIKRDVLRKNGKAEALGL